MSGQYLHKLTENDSLYASVGQSFIMPTFSQMYGASDSAVSNPDLKPQKELIMNWAGRGLVTIIVESCHLSY